MADYQRVIRHVEGIPGSQSRRSTAIVAPSFSPEKRETYVVQTVATPEEGWYIFLDVIDGDGTAHRLALPDKAVQAIYRHRDSVMKERRSSRAKAQARARMAKLKRDGGKLFDKIPVNQEAKP